MRNNKAILGRKSAQEQKEERKHRTLHSLNSFSVFLAWSLCFLFFLLVPCLSVAYCNSVLLICCLCFFSISVMFMKSKMSKRNLKRTTQNLKDSVLLCLSFALESHATQNKIDELFHSSVLFCYIRLFVTGFFSFFVFLIKHCYSLPPFISSVSLHLLFLFVKFHHCN